MTRPLALVTGASRGIGAETARQLARHGYLVLVGARELSAGESVAEEIRLQGGQAHAVSLDVAYPQSVAAAVKGVRERFAGLDALINNAGVALSGFNHAVVKQTLAVNFYGAMQVTDGFLPLLHPHGRIVMLSSGMADRSVLGPDLRSRFSKPLSRAELTSLVEEFAQAVADGTHSRLGWPSSAYRISKMALNVLTETLAREQQHDPRRLLINACCPGWVKTDMGGEQADRSIEEGAETPVWLAMLPPDGPSGGFFRDRAAASW
jgi:carbonyl reductase 1